MKPSTEKISQLLANRYSSGQGQDYWQNFLKEYHYKQRKAALSTSTAARLLQSLRIQLSQLKPSKWAYIAGIAYASASITFFLFPRETQDTHNYSTPINHQIIPTPTTPETPPENPTPEKSQPF